MTDLVVVLFYPLEFGRRIDLFVLLEQIVLCVSPLYLIFWARYRYSYCSPE